MRSRATARKAGSNFAECSARYLSFVTGSDVTRRVCHGSKDTGDLNGIKICGHRLIAECKDYSGRDQMAEWIREAETERGNDDALAGVVISHRRGVVADARNLMRMGDQLVSMTLRDLAALMAGDRESVIEREKEWQER